MIIYKVPACTHSIILVNKIYELSYYDCYKYIDIIFNVLMYIISAIIVFFFLFHQQEAKLKVIRKIALQVSEPSSLVHFY